MKQDAKTRRLQLEAERSAITARIVALEQAGVRPDPSGARAAREHERALALAAGEPDPPTLRGDDDAEELIRLYDRRGVMDRADEVLRRQELAEHADRVHRLMDDERAEWTAAARRRLLAAVQLQRANAEFEILRRRYGRPGTLPTERFRLLGAGGPGDEVRRAAEELVALGIVTRREADLDD